MMRKLMVLLLLVLTVVLVVSCAPKEEEQVDLNSLSDEELDAAMEAPDEDGAIAGQAVKRVSAPQRSARQAGCMVSGDNLILTDKSGGRRSIPRRFCVAGAVNERVCDNSGGYRSEVREQCSNGCFGFGCAPICVDSDSNDDPAVVGNATGLDFDKRRNPNKDPSVLITVKDICADTNGNLNEWNGSHIRQAECEVSDILERQYTWGTEGLIIPGVGLAIPCPQGTTCQRGACVAS